MRLSLAAASCDHAMSVPRSTYAIMWGAVLTGVFTLIPTFKHLRVICVLGLVGTSYTAIYIWAESGKSGLKDNWATGPTSLEVRVRAGYGLCSVGASRSDAHMDV